MAITSGGTIGSVQDKTAGTSFALTTSAQLAAGQIGIIAVAKDNTATSDGNTSEVTSITDGSSNSYVLLREFCNAQSGSNAGATISLWRTRARTTLASGGTITINLAASKTAKAASIWAFNVGTNMTLQLIGTGQDLANDGADPGSMTISGLASQEYLFVRAIAGESDNTNDLVGTLLYTTITPNQTSGNPVASNMGVRGEFHVLTGTGDTSDPLWTSFSGDAASVYVALVEAPVVPPAFMMAGRANQHELLQYTVRAF